MDVRSAHGLSQRRGGGHPIEGVLLHPGSRAAQATLCRAGLWVASGWAVDCGYQVGREERCRGRSQAFVVLESQPNRKRNYAFSQHTFGERFPVREKYRAISLTFS